jgi:Protein of unknown function (DUF1217).
MVSTYLAYNSIVRNFRQSMTRVEQQADVTRNAAYYRENIGKVKSVDDLLKNDRLYQYAMKAYGLEDMTYAKAFMKKVLESDLSDPNSYANKLVDKRYREFAAAFTFGGSETAIAQSENQTDEMIGLYKATVTRQVEAIDEDTRYYNLMIGSVTNVDQLLNDDRLRTYVFAAFGIDDSQWSRDTIRGVLCSDPTDPNSYVNTVWVSRLDEFGSRLDQAKADLVDANTKISDYMAQLSQPGADMNDLRARITMERARLSKSNADIASYNDAISMISRYVDLAAGFEFSPDGTLPSGMPAQIEANREVTNEGFVLSKGAVYLAAEEENETLAINQFRSLIYKMQSVEQFVSTPNVYNFALKAVGLDPQKVSAATIKAVLRSDPTDPKSYVYTLKDDRYVQLARALNFDGKGNVTSPLVAQDSAEVIQIARDYIVAKTKFASSTEQPALRAQAEKDAVYYRNAIADVGSVTELLKDRRMVDILLVSKGLDPAKVTTDYLRKIFGSDLTDAKSFANTESDPRFAEIAASFNFDEQGNVARLAQIGPQKRDQLLETQNNYLQQNLETQQGDANPGVRLALYFQRKAGDITSAYDILADKALAEVFRTTYGLPDSVGSMAVDQQAKVVEKYLNLKDLTDPAKLAKLLNRFSVMYDLKNGSQKVSPALAILQGSGGGIGQDTLMSIAQLGKR